MVVLIRSGMIVFLAALCASGVSAAQDVEQRAYMRAVAGFFQVSETEVGILGHGSNVSAEEIPVVLFVARRGGVSPEAVVALRESGRGWRDLSQRFGVGAGALHVPMVDPASTGSLAPLYERFATTPVGQWSSLRLEDADIVALVNVRVLSQALGVAPDRIAQRIGTFPGFVELYASFLH